MRWDKTAQEDEGPEEKDLEVGLFLVNGALYEADTRKPVGMAASRKGAIDLNAQLVAVLKAGGVGNEPGQPATIQEADHGTVPEVKVRIAYVADLGRTYPARMPSMSDPGEPGGWITEPSNRLEGVDLMVTTPDGKQVQLALPRNVELMVWRHWGRTNAV